MTDIDALAALAEAATPGLWAHYRDTLRLHAHRLWLGFDDSARPEKQHAANARYIAAMSPDVALALIAELRALRTVETAVRQHRAAEDAALIAKGAEQERERLQSLIDHTISPLSALAGLRAALLAPKGATE